MKLPERARPLLDTLRSYSCSESARAFRDSARARFGREADEAADVENEFEDYLLYSHRDTEGRSLVDHFLAHPPTRLDSEKRDAFLRFGRSEFGFFRVESVRPGEGLDLRRVGDDSEFSVVDTLVSRTVAVKMGLLARLVPYRSWYEFGSPPLKWEADAAYNVERSVRRLGPRAIEELADPLLLYETLRELRKQRPPQGAENRLEAELLAQEVFAELRLPVSVAELQERFPSLSSPAQLLRELQLPPFESEAAVRRFFDVVVQLWNHTPRPELGGKTPHESEDQAASAGQARLSKPLARDLLRELAARIDPEEFPDKDSRRTARRIIEEEWMATPQSELDGRTPGDVLQDGMVPPLPPETQLPPPDAPIQDLESIETRLRNAHRCPWAAAWAIRYVVEQEWIPRLADGVLRSAVFTLLDSREPPGVATDVIDALLEAPQDIRTEYTQEVRAALEVAGDNDKSLQCSAVQWLAKTSPAEHMEVFRRILDEQDPLMLTRLFALQGLAASGDSESRALLLATLKDGTLLEKGQALSGLLLELVAAGNAEPLRQALLAQLEKGLVEESVELLYEALRTVGATYRLRATARWALFPDDENGGDGGYAHDSELNNRLEALLPQMDAAARSRGRRALPAESGHELLRGIDAGKLRLAGRRLLKVAKSALELLIEEATLGVQARAILVVVEAVETAKWHEDCDRQRRSDVLTFLATVLGWAIRGRDVAAEWKEAEGDHQRVASLSVIDLGGLDRRHIEQTADQLSTEELSALVRGTDDCVVDKALAAMAVKEPEGALVAALERAWDFGDSCEICAAVARRQGDRVIPILVDWVRDHDSDDNRETLLNTLAVLGTRRAAVAARQTIEAIWFQVGERPCPFLAFELTLSLGDVALMEYVLKKFEAGGFDLGTEADRPGDKAACVRYVNTLLEVTDRKGDGQAIVENAIERFRSEQERRRLPSRPRVARDSRVDALPADDEERETTIRRDGPKVGRNDPCPCGSGRKYKKCCGKN